MKLLVNGCSFSRGPTAWANHLAGALNASLINLAQAGAGNTYIAQSTQAELATREYDFVVIMWSGLERLDIQVDRIENFEQTHCTSWYQSSQNDWPEKIVIPVNDQDYVQKDWVFGVGHLNRDNFLLKLGLFDKQYKYQDLKQHIQRSLFLMISLQSYLKVKKIPYVFAFYQNYIDQLKTFNNLYQQLDFECIYNKTNLADISSKLNSFDPDKIHPGPLAHETWACNLYNWIKKHDKHAQY